MAKKKNNHSQHNLTGPSQLKPTGPGLVTMPAKSPKATMPSPEPKHARRVWNKARPKRAVEASSRIANFTDGGVKTYPSTPHLAPGVPRNKATLQGYVGPNEKMPGKTRRGGGGGTYDTETTAGAGIGAAHGGYSAT